MDDTSYARLEIDHQEVIVLMFTVLPMQQSHTYLTCDIET